MRTKSLVVLTTILIVAILAGCQPPAAEPTVVAASPTTPPTPAPTIQPTPEATSPEEITAAFYDWYLGFIGDRATGEFRNPLVEKAYQDSPYLSPGFVQRVDEIIAGFEGGGYDPFLCAQDIPGEITTEAAFVAGELAGGTASVAVRTDFPGHVFTVDLRKEDGQWKISNITCGNTPAGLAKAFYAWYLGYIGSPATGNLRNPLVDKAYQNSGFLTEDLIQRVDDIVAGFERGGYDPFLLAQDIPQGFSVDPGMTEDTAIVHLLFGPDSSRHLVITTIMDNNMLLISDISEAQAPNAPAADATSLAGRWEGKLVVAGVGLEIFVNFSDEGGELSGAIDIPAQGAAGIPLHDIRYDALQVHFEMLAGPQLAVFDGEIMPDGSISGKFGQSGVEGTFELARPQEQATEPLPYTEEEVTFGHDDVTLAGTLTLPEGDGPFPAVILLTGSGQQNRDEEISIVPGYKPFRVIADHLARNGIAVLRYDDRGIGGSTGDVANATTADFADDAEAALDYLLNRPEIDPEQIGLLGHSEGGMIVAMLAAARPDVAFAIPMAGIAVSGYDTLIKQVERLALASGMSEQEAAEAAATQRAVLDLAVAEDWEALEAKLTEIVTEQIDALPEAQKATLGDPQAVIQQQVASQLQIFRSPWYQYFLAYDPAKDWTQVTVPVLALFGGKDAQVDAEQNRVALEAALQQAGNDDVTVVVFPTANHLFQDAQTGAFEEYATLAPEFVPDFLDTISEWLLARLK